MAVVILVAAAGSAAMGCSAKGPQYPEDHARYKRINEAVEHLRQAYASKDVSAVTNLMLAGDINDRIEQDIRNDFQQFEDISVVFSIDRIVIEGDTIDVFLHWQGHWKRHRDDTGIRERGHGVLRWVGIQSILLQGVEGDLPFGMAARQPDQPSGQRPS